MKKRVFIIMIIGALMMTNLVIMAQTFPTVGTYITMGSYKGDKIAWQVVDVDTITGDAVLVSANIVDYMVFDAAESGIAGYGSSKEASGSNVYSTSNVFEWLNSDEQSVTYSTALPKASGISTYEDFEGNQVIGITDTQAGFLQSFSMDERAAMLTRTYNQNIGLESVSSEVFLLSNSEVQSCL